MKKSQHKSFGWSIFTIIFLTMLFFNSGCGFVSLLGTPGRYERSILAEYELAQHKDQKILVLVKQSAWLSSRANLQYYLTKRLHENLEEKIEIPTENFVSYEQLSEFRSNHTNYSLLTPVEIGKALQADIVLSVTIGNYKLYEMAGTGFHKGFLSAQAVLLETATDEKLWPEEEENSKTVSVGFEVEQRGRKVAVARMISTSAHCIVRYLYECPKDKFKTADDRRSEAWESW